MRCLLRRHHERVLDPAFGADEMVHFPWIIVGRYYPLSVSIAPELMMFLGVARVIVLAMHSTVPGQRKLNQGWHTDMRCSIPFIGYVRSTSGCRTITIDERKIHIKM